MPELKHHHGVQIGVGEEDKERKITERFTGEEGEGVLAETTGVTCAHGGEVQPDGQGDEPASISRTEHRVQVHL